MSLIKNLVKESENKPRKKKDGKDKEGDDAGEDQDQKTKLRPFVKSVSDLQRLRLDKLMKNPDKPILLPEPKKEKDYLQSVPSFVRNVMGSSAGAGSGEFHVYRHLRRKEYARQKNIQAKSTKEQLDDEYQQKLEDNRRNADDKTAKKRAKRLKKKERAKRARKNKKDTPKDEEKTEETTEDDDDDEDDEIGADQPSLKQDAEDDNAGQEAVCINLPDKSTDTEEILESSEKATTTSEPGDSMEKNSSREENSPLMEVDKNYELPQEKNKTTTSKSDDTIENVDKNSTREENKTMSKSDNTLEDIEKNSVGEEKKTSTSKSDDTIEDVEKNREKENDAANELNKGSNENHEIVKTVESSQIITKAVDAIDEPQASDTKHSIPNDQNPQNLQNPMKINA